ncbi:MAG: hypothetical protein PWQ97_866 [Tepidanaerobacteraceae bacterium]|nr:hypothetical protein [Tepidanaerobacteraceae bacterium]
MINWSLFVEINEKMGMSILAGFLAAAVSYYLNGKALALMGENAVTYGAPVIEEVSKTGIAVLVSGDILFTHIIFGTAEALCDIIKNRGRRSYTAGAAGLMSHAAFGAITVFFHSLLKSLLVGVAAAVTVHMFWNYIVLNAHIKDKK